MPWNRWAACESGFVDTAWFPPGLSPCDVMELLAVLIPTYPSSHELTGYPGTACASHLQFLKNPVPR